MSKLEVNDTAATQRFKRVLVTGGAGYVGSELVPQLLQRGYEVTVLDTYWFGQESLSRCRGSSALREVKGDLRDLNVVRDALQDCKAVIHLACISNDPSFEMDPTLGKSINYDAFRPLVREAKIAGVERFVYASSSSVYGVKSEQSVTENLSLEPLTDYSKFKAMCEDVLLEEKEDGFSVLTFRPATVCGYAPRLRLDVAVNVLTNHAVNRRIITVFGGTQTRPNIHISDMVRAYLNSLQWSDQQIDGKVYNVGYENHMMSQIAQIVQSVIGADVQIVTKPTDDLRSYRISSDLIRQDLGFEAKSTIVDAVKDLQIAFANGSIPASLSDPRYSNIQTMKSLGLTPA